MGQLYVTADVQFAEHAVAVAVYRLGAEIQLF